MFALNQGEVCTCPSRALVQSSIYSDFVPDAVARVEKIKQGNPLDTETTMGAQASNDQLEKILSYMDIGRQEGAKILTGGDRNVLDGDLAEGYYVAPTIFEGNNSMRIFQEEIFGPVVSLTTFDDEADALDRQRHALRPRRRRVDPGRLARLPDGPRHQGRSRVDELLPPVPRARRVRWLQAVRHRPREPQDDARPLPADEEPPRLLLARRPRLLLTGTCTRWRQQTGRPGEPSASPSRVDLTGEAADLLRRLTGIHGPLMFHQSGGCCDGSSPMCYPAGDFMTSEADVQLGDLVVAGLEAPSASGCRCRSTSTGSTRT